MPSREASVLPHAVQIVTHNFARWPSARIEARLADVFIGDDEVFCAKAHHMTALVAFKAQPVAEATTRIEVHIVYLTEK